MSRLPFASAQREGRGDMRESEVYADKGVTTPSSTTAADPPAAIHHLDLGGGAKAVLPSAGADSAPATMTERPASGMTLEGGITATLPSAPIPAAATSIVQVRLLPPPSLLWLLLLASRGSAALAAALRHAAAPLPVACSCSFYRLPELTSPFPLLSSDRMDDPTGQKDTT